MTSLLLLATLAASPFLEEEAPFRPLATHRAVELSLGSGYNAPSGLLGLELAVRPLPRWSLAIALGGAPASTNPDPTRFNPLYGLVCTFGGCKPLDRVQHIGLVPFRISFSTSYHHPLDDRVELSLRLGVERNPGAVRTLFEYTDECDEWEDIDCVDWDSYEQVTPTTWVGLATVGLTFHFHEHTFLRVETGGVLPLVEELSDSENRAVDRSTVPSGPTISFWLGWRIG